MKKVESSDFPGGDVKEVGAVTSRTKAVGFGTGLVVVGLVLVYNFGLASLLHSPVFGEYNLTDPFTIEVSSRAVVTDDVELLRWNTMPEFVSPDDVRPYHLGRMRPPVGGCGVTRFCRPLLKDASQ